MTKTLPVIACCLLAGAASSSAQVRVVRHGDDRLSGIAEVDVVVRAASDQSTRCAAAQAPLQNLVVGVLRDARVRATVSEKSSSWFYSVLVTVSSTAVERSCAAAVTTELIAHVEAVPDSDRGSPPGTWGSLLVGQLPLLSESALVTPPLAEHDAVVQKVLREQVTTIAHRIRAARP